MRAVAEVRAFRAVRYDERAAGPLSDLICPPYDVISPAQHEALLERNERNFVRVELPEPTPVGYSRASGFLDEWAHAHLVLPDPPSLYLHEHEFALGGQRLTRRGVFVALRLYRAADRVVLPHEHTFPKAKADRLELLRATRTNTSPIFGMIDGRVFAAIRDASAAIVGEAMLGEDRHVLRRVLDTQSVSRFRDALRPERVYIADGHHRYETALTYADERGADPEAPERYTLAYLCALDDPGLRILATHRVVAGGGAALDAAIARSFDAAPIDRGGLGDVQPGIVLVRDGRFARLEVRSNADRSSMPAAWRELPVAIAEELLLKAARGAGAEITYEHDIDRAIDSAHDGRSAVLLRAVDPATLRAVSDAGERLPQKTTYFYPKVPSGLVIRSLDLG
jgi:uncharacterized protein (DUF1015 family)